MKGRNFSSLRDTGNPITAAKVYDAQRVDELVFLDIAATEENRRILFDVVQGVAEQCFMPLTVGGGVRTLDDMRRLLQMGADKVAVNTAAVERPALVEEAARTFGSANVVVSIDARRRAGGRHEVWTHSGRQATPLEPVQWARQVAAAGAGEILITSIDREGTMAGYDLELVGAVADAVAVPVIANGDRKSVV